jgi:UDP-N-acetylglucosamine 2-epimerase (non-hydrolysing)
MKKVKVAIFTGTRPELIKLQPLIEEVRHRKSIRLTFIHTQQHYSFNMSTLFIKELKLPEPSFFLDVKSGSQGFQTARIISRSERLLKREGPDVVLVEGDTNSALGVALAASKLKIPIGHIEAGCRSFDKNMPEEINRVLIADLASAHFAPTRSCVSNLLKEGISADKIFLTGHPIVDVLHQFQKKIGYSATRRLELKPREYYFTTVHRKETVESKAALKEMVESLSALSTSRPVVFPIHPHTLKFIKRFKFEKYLKSLVATEPVGYLDALDLVSHSKVVLTDSGGIQQEAALLGTPCITLRNNTEWPETIECGVNFLASGKEEIMRTVEQLEREYEQILDRFKLAKSIFGKFGVSRRIVDILERLFIV